MKQIIFFVMLALGTLLVNAVPVIPMQKLADGPQIEFSKSDHDFGDIRKNVNATFKFIFTNTGNDVLVISDVKTSCGCTVPSWPKEPVLPGGKGAITIVYEADETGAFSKNIKVISNATNSMIELRISGNVIE